MYKSRRARTLCAHHSSSLRSRMDSSILYLQWHRGRWACVARPTAVKRTNSLCPCRVWISIRACTGRTEGFAKTRKVLVTDWCCLLSHESRALGHCDYYWVGWLDCCSLRCFAMWYSQQFGWSKPTSCVYMLCTWVAELGARIAEP